MSLTKVRRPPRALALGVAAASGPISVAAVPASASARVVSPPCGPTTAIRSAPGLTQAAIGPASRSVGRARRASPPVPKCLALARPGGCPGVIATRPAVSTAPLTMAPSVLPAVVASLMSAGPTGLGASPSKPPALIVLVPRRSSALVMIAPGVVGATPVSVLVRRRACPLAGSRPVVAVTVVRVGPPAAISSLARPSPALVCVGPTSTAALSIALTGGSPAVLLPCRASRHADRIPCRTRALTARRGCVLPTVARRVIRVPGPASSAFANGAVTREATSSSPPLAATAVVAVIRLLKCPGRLWSAVGLMSPASQLPAAIPLTRRVAGPVSRVRPIRPSVPATQAGWVATLTTAAPTVTLLCPGRSSVIRTLHCNYCAAAPGTSPPVFGASAHVQSSLPGGLPGTVRLAALAITA